MTPSGLSTVGVALADGVADVVGVGVALAVGVGVNDGVSVGLGDGCGLCADPTTQIFPDESKVAAVAISLAPLSSGKDQSTVPVESSAWMNPSVLTTPVTVPMR